MNENELNNALENLKYEYSKLDTLYNNLQEQLVDVLKYGEIAVIDCTMDYKITSSYGAFDVIFQNLNKSYSRNKDIIDLINNSVNEIDDDDIEVVEGQEPFYKIDVKNEFLEFLKSSKKQVILDIFGKFNNDEIYLLQVKLIKLEGFIRAFVKIMPSSFFLRKYEQRFNKEITKKDKILDSIVNSLSVGITILDSRNRILLMNQTAKDHHFSDAAKILKNAQVEGRLYCDIFTNENNEEVNTRMQHHGKVLARGDSVKYSKNTNEKNVNFEIYPIKNDGNLVDELLVISSLNAMPDVDSDLKISKLTSLAKHFKLEGDNLKERVKELELNQTWLMKKGDESNNNNKLLHESLRQLYHYLEILPFPMAILDLPNLKYEFINKSYLAMIGRDKKEVLSRKDEQVFSEELASELAHRVAESITGGLAVPVTIHGYKGKQYMIKNEKGQPQHIMRIFNT